MADSTNLILPYLAAGQAQKHVTVNETLRKLDALVHLSVESATTSAQPGSPSDGQNYILPSGKTGSAWGAMTNLAIAYYRDGAWEEISPREGFSAYVRDTDKLLVYSGSAWVLQSLPSSGGVLTGELEIDFGSGAVPGTLPTNGVPYLHLLAADGAHPGRSLFDGFGGHIVHSFRRANGTRAAPSAIQSGDSFGQVNVFGYGASDYCTSNAAALDFIAAENWTNSAQGTYIEFSTTPIGSAAASLAKRVRINANGYVAIAAAAGGLVADARLTVSDNASGATPGSLPSGTVGHLVAADSAATRFGLDAFAAGPQFWGRRAQGSLSSPSAVASGNALCQVAGFGYGATGYSSGSRANLILNATEAWTDTAQGAGVVLQGTANGSTATSELGRFDMQNGSQAFGSGNIVLDANRVFRRRVFTVATLPAGVAGMNAFVSDATATTFASVVAGGGANGVPVYSDGTNWRIG